MEASIIIRVKNEEENLKKLFIILKNQTYQDFEVIIVDNNSTDSLDKTVFKYFPEKRIQIVKISKFTYPKSCNLGAKKAKGKYLVYLSAHSYPISNTWLENGLQNFKNYKVAGIFGFPIYKFSDSSFAEVICYTIPNYIRAPFKNNRYGELGNTNSIIRRDLWKKHIFNESFINGSEDFEWSRFWKKNGYLIVNDPKFAVYHSHNLSFREIFNRQRKWIKIRKEIK